MNIHEFLKQYGCEIIEPQDNQKIQALYNSLDMSSDKFSVSTRKEPDYFRFLKYAAEKYYAIGFPNAQGALEGMVSLIVRPCYLDGKLDVVGHFLDLRFIRKRDRTITAEWKPLGRGFTRGGRDVDELDGCNIFHGSYIATNIYATQSIGEDSKSKPAADKAAKREATPKPNKEKPPREKREEAFLVSNLATYQSINLFARKPQKAMGFGSFKKSGKRFVVSRGEEQDREPLKAFLDQQNRLRAFGYVFAKEQGELERRFRDWDGFSMSSFFIARDEARNIVGTFGAFDPIKGRQIYIDKIPSEKALIAKVGKVVGLKIPEPNKKIEILYLTTFELDHGCSHEERLDVLDALLDGLYKSGLPKEYHMVSFCDYNKQSLLEVVESGYLYDATPVMLYQIYAPGESAVYREDDLNYSPGHEMVLM